MSQPNTYPLLKRHNYINMHPPQITRTPNARTQNNLKEIEELNKYLEHAESMCKIYTNYKKLIKDKLKLLGENKENKENKENNK